MNGAPDAGAPASGATDPDGLDPRLASLLPRCTFPAPGTPVTCALSGGADSSALTALAVAAGLEVSAVHVDHGLRPDSPDDAAAAERIAAGLGVAFTCLHVEIEAGPNQEARARDARRAALGRDALTGHTADDQAETVLLALLRGAGAAGLAAMAPGPTHPILGLRRHETRALCAALDLPVVDDPTNLDPAFRRNRVRHELVPLLDEIAARDVVPLLARAADLLRDDDALLDSLADRIDPTDARQLAEAPLPLARRAVRRWLTSGGYPPDAAGVERVLEVARGTVRACEVTPGHRIERSGQRLALR